MPDSRTAKEVVLMTAEQMSRTTTRLAHEILERNPGQSALAIVGIHTRGVFMAERIHKLLCETEGPRFASGALDITFYRDDVGRDSATGVAPIAVAPVVKRSELPFPVQGATIILVDDVLYTGRTVRAAIDAIFDHGRPEGVQLAVLVDRGHRVLPIRADYVGKNVPTAQKERISVRFPESDGVEEVVLVRAPEED
jgi:pyrimidine operon attenuation protein / uracil phosphoribosyltransferase